MTILLTAVVAGGSVAVMSGTAAASTVTGSGTGGSQFEAISAAVAEARAQCGGRRYIESAWDSYLIEGNTRWAAWTRGFCS